jgi:hypothetical protein
MKRLNIDAQDIQDTVAEAAEGADRETVLSILSIDV